VRHVLDQVEREREKLSAWRRVLELTNATLLRGSRSDARPAVPDAELGESVEER
jgi:hypothetical protein